MSTDGDAVFVHSTGAFFLTISGTIVSNHRAIVMDDILGSRLLPANSGTIQAKGNIAIVSSSGVDSIFNSGIIIGQITLGDGSDRFDTHLGMVSNLISGGTGDDRFTIAGTKTLFDYQNQGNDSVFSYGDYALPDNFENLYLQGRARNGWGNDGSNVLSATGFDTMFAGRGDNDLLQAAGGDDVLKGGRGNDYLTGGSGDNRLFGGVGDDSLLCDIGESRLDEGAGSDRILGNEGGTVVIGGDGTDVLTYAAGAGGVIVDLAAGTGSEGTSVDTLIAIEDVSGTSSADTLTGSTAANLLRGGSGADTIRGGKGVDTLEGGNDDETLHADQGADILVFADVIAGTPGGWDTDLVYGFENGVDRISFVGAGAIHSMTDLSRSVASDDVVIATSVAGDVIRMIGFAVGDLDSTDFIFAPASERIRFSSGDCVDVATLELVALP